ncbi:hypothetical protein V2J09_004635 [Rumex salicifolius]
MATTLTTISSTIAPSPSSLRRRPRHANNFLKPPTLMSPEREVCFRFFPLTSPSASSFSLPVRASDPEREGNPSIVSPDSNSNTISSFQEDAIYLWKLALGSVIGAAIIKYGCIVFPDITKPDLVQALIMISAPAIASVILLVLGSRQE